MTSPWHRLPLRAMLRTFAVALVAVSALSFAVVAHALWSASGGGVGSATTAALNPPAAVTISSFGPTVTVNWTAVTPPGGTLAGYTVTRYAGATPSNACGTDPATPATFVPAGTLTCSDTSVADGTYAYTVTAVFRTWSAQSAQSNAITVVGDQTKPSQSIVLAPGASNAHFVGATLYYRATASGSFQLVDTVTGVASAPASAAFPVIGATGWAHPAETVTSGTGSAPTIDYNSSSFAWTSSPANPASYSVTGADTLGNTVSTPLSFTSDTTGPTGGALTVNATAASTGGTTSTTNASFSINLRTDYGADVGAGMATSLLTSEPAPLTNNTCGAFGAASTIIGSPAQTGLATGCYRYTLTGTDNVGNASGISTIVKYDTGLPTQAVTLTSGVGASQTGSVIYFRNTVPGSFLLSTAVTDTESGPASASFPVIATAGWTHPVQTVSSGTGSPPTIAYSSSTYSFGTGAGTPGTHSVVGKDNAGNTATTALTFVKDTTGPTGGALTVNSVASSTGGSSSFNKTGGFTIGTRTDYTVDAGAGVGSSVLTVATAALSANTCGTYGTASVITGSPAQSGLTTGCWKYVLTGTDKVGNVATPLVTTVKVDLVVPATGALTVNALAASGAGTTGGPTNAASFPINSRIDYTDAESGIKTSTLTRQAASLTAGVCGTFTGTITTLVGTPLQSALATSCYKYLLTGTDNALNATAIFTIVKNDITAPTAGALTVNAVAASAAGTSSTTNAGSFTIGTRTDFTDAASGIGSSVLTVASATLSANTCGTYGSPATITGFPAQSGLTTGCWKYVLTGTDQAGNVATTMTTVKVDLLPATGGAVTVNGLAANGAGTTSGPTNAASFPIDSRADWTDGESGLGTSTLTRAPGTFTAGACGAFGTKTSLVGTPLQTGLATSCYQYLLTGTDNAGNATSISTIVKYDVTAPTAGALTVNAVAASAAGTSSTTNAGSFTIATRTANTDAASGLLSSTLTRQFGALTAPTTCGAFGSSTTIVGNPAQTSLATGCYLYTLTGIDNAGNSTSITTTVKLGVYVTAVALTNGTGTAGRPDQGDQIVVTFSDTLDVSTLCSTWSGNGSDQAINGDNQATATLNDLAGSDTLTLFSSACTLNFGTLSLGSTAYTTATVTFGGAGANKSTIAWNVATRQLTITLGQVSAAGPAIVASSIVTYTPSTAILNVSGVPTGGIFVTTSVKQF